MVFQMAHIVDRQEFERHGVVIADPAGVLPVGTGNRLYQMEKMAIIGAPERYQITPGKHFIVLDRDPLFLGIAGHDDPALDLRADEAVVIVGGRIKQMAEDLFAGPFFRGTVFRRTGFGGSGGAGVGVSETGKLGRYASEDPPKFFDGGFKRFHNRLYRSWRGPPSTYGKFRRQG